MNFIFSGILYVVVALLMHKGGLTLLDNTLMYIAIVVCISAIDVLGYMRGYEAGGK